MLLAACAVMAKAQVSFDFSSGEPGCQTHLRLPKVEKDVKAILYCHQTTMIDKHSFVTGSSSQKEHFFDLAKFSKFINGYTGETCCTYNMLKLSRHLFCWEANPAVADYYERALFNHILAQ